MNTENLILKRSLMLQSFAPLFALLAIKYFNPAMFWHLTVSFVKLFSDKGMVAVPIAVANKNFGSFFNLYDKPYVVACHLYCRNRIYRDAEIGIQVGRREDFDCGFT